MVAAFSFAAGMATALIPQAAYASSEEAETTRPAAPRGGLIAGLEASRDSLRVTESTVPADAQGRYSVIVRFTEPSLASYEGGVQGLAATSPRVRGERRLDVRAPQSQAYLSYLKGRQATYLSQIGGEIGRSMQPQFQYLAALNGVALRLTLAEAAKLRSLPGVLTVQLDELRYPDTDVGPGHIGAPAVWNGNTTGAVATRGEGVVVGIIDTGINFSNASFAATDGDGYAHTNPYGAGVYRGWCATNPGFCNEKLIAARGLNPVDQDPTDTNGHGSHTAGTAAGNRHDASITVGADNYVLSVSGVAPRANIVAYKVCNPSCPGSASIAAVNHAIVDDDVDVLNYSISGSDSPWDDPVDLAFLDAFNAGIYVAASAGNAGPGPSTAAKSGPWNASVGASTHNRAIVQTLDVTSQGEPIALQGLFVVPAEGTNILANITAGLVYDATNNLGCTAFAPGTFTGNLALIQRGGGCTFALKATNAQNAGATGVVLFQSVGGPPITAGGTPTPPLVMMDLTSGIALRDHVLANPGDTTVRINASTSLVYVDEWEDIVGGFSSRGPSQYDLMLPTFVAPGVNILAASAGAVDSYGFQQGTSMASPHAAGAGALLRALNPTWSPAEIRSALALAANPSLLSKENGITPADPFDQGSGLLDLASAGAISLVMDETGANFAAANPGTAGDPRTLNVPSLIDRDCIGSCSFTRTVSSVIASSQDYTVATTAPTGITVTVSPNAFTLAAGANQVLTIDVGVDINTANLGNWNFGEVRLVPAGGALPTARLPLAVVPKISPFPDISVDVASISSTQPVNQTETRNLQISNSGGMDLVWSIAEAPAAVRLDLSLGDEKAVRGVGSPYSLVLDDGSGEDAIGVSGAQFIWLNRFTPSATTFPVTLDSVDVMFGYPGAPGGINVGELVDIYLYEDADGNPANGATHRASLNAQAVQAVDGVTWSSFTLTAPVTFTGPGDILIAVVNRTAGVTPSTFPAVIDQNSPSQGRSWAGFGAVPGDPPVLPLPTFGVIDSFGAQLAGNWLVRGFGTTNIACDNPSDVSWLSVNPAAGTTPTGAQTQVTVSLDSTGLPVGSYGAALCLESNDPDRPLIVIPVSLEVEPSAGIALSETELAGIAIIGSSAQASFDIGNVGDAQLDWTTDTAGPSTIAPMGTPPLLLHDNGPFITSTGDGPAGSDVSLLQNVSLGTTTLGAGVQFVAPGPHNRIADQFTVSSTDGWDMRTVRFFGYQTGSSTTSSFTGVTLQIWDGEPGAAGSNVVFGDISTNRFADTGWTGAYRFSENNVGNTQRPIMFIDATVNTVLPPGEYWLDWQLAGTIASGPWQPPITIIGQAATGDARQQISTGWQPFVDGGAGNPAQGVPFLIRGFDDWCYAPSAVSWLSVSPAGGSTAPAGSDTVTVTMDATGLTVGNYEAKVCVFSNDPLSPLVSLPVSFEVTQVPQTIDFALLDDRSIGESPFTLSATASSGLAVSFASLTGSVCSVTDSDVSLLAIGTCSIEATQAGDATYLPAVPVTRSFEVLDADVVVSPGSLQRGTIDVPYSVTFTASGAGTTTPFTYAVTDGALPAGLALASNGELTGTPAENGVFAFTVTATDSTDPGVGGPFSGSRAYTLEIDEEFIFFDGFESPVPLLKLSFAEEGRHVATLRAGRAGWAQAGTPTTRQIPTEN